MPVVAPSLPSSTDAVSSAVSPHRRVRLAFIVALALIAGTVALALNSGDHRITATLVGLSALTLVGVVERVVRLVRNQHALALRHAQQLERLSVAAQRTTNGVVFTDALRRITWVNEGFTRVTGYTLDEVIGRSPGRVLQCERTSRETMAAMRAALDAGAAFRGDILNRGKDGRDYWLDLDIQPLHDAGGTLTGFSAIETDITEQVVQRERLASIFNTITEGVLLIARDGTILESNRAASQILGLSDEQLRARGVTDESWDSVHLDGSTMSADQLPSMVTLRTGEPVHGVVHGLRFPDDSRRWISVSTQPMFDPHGEITSVVSSFSDVTTMLDQEHRMQLVVKGGGLGTWDWHIASGHVSYNARFAECLGYELHELEPTIAMWENLQHPDDRARVLSALTAHLEGETPEFRCQHRLQRKDGSWAWLLGVGQVTERDTSGRPIRVTGIKLDISAQKALESRAAEVQDQYQAAIAGTSDGLWDWHVATDRVWRSPRCFELLGVPPGVVLPDMNRDEFMRSIHPDDRPEAQRAFNALWEHDVSVNVTHRMRQYDGTWHWYRTRCRAQRDARGHAIRLAGSIQDIQATKEAEATLQRTALQLEEAQAVARIGSWSFDLVTGEIEWSKQCYILDGFDEGNGPPDLKIVLDTYVDEDAARLEAAIAQAATDGTPYSLVLHKRRGENGVRVVRGDGRVRKDADGRIVGLYGTVKDVTEEFEREDALRAAQSEAERANEMLLDTNRVLEDATMRANDMAAQAEMASHAKSEFLANMSHEIRTPLTAILGYADLLREELVDSETGAHAVASIDTIRRAGEHLLIVINDILDLSKIEAGAMQIETVDMALPQLLFDLDSMMQARANAKDIALRTCLGSPIPDRIVSDPTRLRQILMNLVGNAVKFTDAGSVDVRVMVSDTESRETPVLRIEVDDTGPGMTPKQARNLFQPFTQADSTVTRRHGGTGLGLTICRRLAGLMHGTVRLDRSVPGEGSRFVVELPLIASVDTPMVDNLDVFVRRRPAPNAHITTLATGRLRGRILLAEDGEDNRRLITYHLTKAGAVVDVAVNGRVALDLLEASRLDGRPYDLLVTDMQMPVMDGYTLARTLRKRGSVLPIVALTAHAMAEDREKCIEAGCNDYATKPIDRARLIATCAAWLPPDDGAPNAPVDPVPAVATSRAGNESARSAEDVLISDLADDPDMLPLVHEFLRQLPDRMALFDTHREPEQRSALASAAHQMKGAAGGYGYMSISELARTVERFASAGGTQAECDKAINALLSRCRAAIRGGLPADAAGMTTQGMTP